MGVVFACIAPHGAEVIPEIAGNMIDAFSETRKGMMQLADLAQQLNVETIILATPHGLRLHANIGIVTSQFTQGSLEENDKTITLRCECDREAASSLLESSEKTKLPIVGANYGTSEGPASCMPMDWGTLIPLWFLIKQNDLKAKVVIVTPSREIPLSQLVDFGHVIADVAESAGKRMLFVASADQGHAHKNDGPYGFNAASKEFDGMVVDAVQKDNLAPLLQLPSKFIEDAKPDSIWQIAMLQGVLDRTHLKGDFISYQVPTYYGLLCASFTQSGRKQTC